MHDAKLLRKLYQSGQISRRDFMQGAAAVGMSATAATGFVSRVAAATPKRGGDAIAASAGGATSDNLDVATWVNQHQMITGMATNEYLTETDASETLKPRLAKSWEAADKGAKWVFKLEKGVEHSNGKTVDAEDVIASLRYHVGEDSKSYFKPQVEQIAGAAVRPRPAPRPASPAAGPRARAWRRVAGGSSGCSAGHRSWRSGRRSRASVRRHGAAGKTVNPPRFDG